MTLWTPEVYSALRKAGVTLEPWAARLADQYEAAQAYTGLCIVCRQPAPACACMTDHQLAGGA